MKHNLEKVYHWNKWIVNIYDLIRLIMHNHSVNSVRFNWDTWGYVGVYPLRYYFFFISRGYICFKKCGLFFFLSAIHKSMALFISECVYCDAFFSSCFSSPSYLLRISQVVLMVKKPACQCRRCKRCGFDPWAKKIPSRRKWQPTLVFFSGESHGQREWTRGKSYPW